MFSARALANLAHNRATEQMRTYKPAEHEETTSVAPLMQFFELVHIGDTIQSMVQVYFDKELVGPFNIMKYCLVIKNFSFSDWLRHHISTRLIFSMLSYARRSALRMSWMTPLLQG